MSRNSNYVATFRIKRRLKIIAYLGGKCVECDAVDDLDVDHIDPSTKSFTIADNLQRRWEVIVTELGKCQLLCRSCHDAKTKRFKENGQKLDFDQVIEIRQRYVLGNITQTELAAEYGISQTTVSDIITGKRRKNG